MDEKEKSTQEIYLPQGKSITIKDKTFSIKPFVLRNRMKFVSIIAEVIKKAYKDNAGYQNSDFIYFVIGALGEKLLDVYKIVLEGVDEEWMLNNITVKDEYVILQTVAEVNDLDFLLQEVKKLTTKQNPVQLQEKIA